MTELFSTGYSSPPDRKPLSPSLENYLEIIFMEEARQGAARASSIAEAAGVSRSTVTSTLKALKRMGLVEYAPYSLVHLTEEGRAIGRDIAHRHFIFREFFLHILQLEEKQADAVACELEHVVPPHVIRRWGQFILYLRGKDFWQNWQEEYHAEYTPPARLPAAGHTDERENVRKGSRA